MTDYNSLLILASFYIVSIIALIALIVKINRNKVISNIIRSKEDLHRTLNERQDIVLDLRRTLSENQDIVSNLESEISVLKCDVEVLSDLIVYSSKELTFKDVYKVNCMSAESMKLFYDIYTEKDEHEEA